EGAQRAADSVARAEETRDADIRGGGVELADQRRPALDLIGEVARLLQARAEEEIAVRKERVPAPAIVGRPAERGQIVGQVIEPLGPRSHAVVVSEEIEDLAVGTGRDERADPLLRRIGRALDR